MMKNKYHFIVSGLVGIIIAAATILLLTLYYPLNFNAKGSLDQIKTESYKNKQQINSMSSKVEDYSDSQWYIQNPGFYYNYSNGFQLKIDSVPRVDMNISKAWENSKNTGKPKRKVVIAIIDTGVDYRHPDLTKNMWINYGEIPGDNIDNDNNGYVDDIYGWDFYNDDSSICHYDESGNKAEASSEDNDNHGTHIAGIIAAANNGIGITGVASNIDVKIMTLKINGGPDSNGRMSDAIAAIKYATMMGADICNLSWGTTEYSKDLKDAMKESDMLFVAAAGNSRTNIDKEPMYPAEFKLSNLITVTSIDSLGELNQYSNYGIHSVDLAAPGGDIYSTIVGGGYASMSGSSMAVPQVTAVAAMLYAYNDHIYAAEVKDLMMNNLKVLPELKGKMKYPGIPDAYKALKAIKKLVQDSKAPILSLKTEVHNKVITVPVQVKDIGGSKVRVIKWLKGKKNLEDFKRGTIGTTIKNNKVDLTQGNYTFYASDYAGNETVNTYKVAYNSVKTDLNIPDIANSKIYNNIAVALSNRIEPVKYQVGERNKKDLKDLNTGTKIPVETGSSRFENKEDLMLTYYPADFRRNTTVELMALNNEKASKLKKMNAISRVTHYTNHIFNSDR